MPTYPTPTNHLCSPPTPLPPPFPPLQDEDDSRYDSASSGPRSPQSPEDPALNLSRGSESSGMNGAVVAGNGDAEPVGGPHVMSETESESESESDGEGGLEVVDDDRKVIEGGGGGVRRVCEPARIGSGRSGTP